MKPQMLKLPAETGEMLRELGRQFREPLSDILATLVIAECQKLGIEPPILGVSVALKADGIRVRLDDCELEPMTPEQVVSFADTIEAVASGDYPNMTMNLDTPDCITVRRVGPGIAIIVPGGKQYRRVFAKGVARALEAKLRLAATRAAVSA